MLKATECIFFLTWLLLVGVRPVRLLRLRLYGKDGEGSVTGFDKHEFDKHEDWDDTDQKTVYRPQVTFRTQAGTCVTASSQTQLQQVTSHFRIGSKVTIRYLPTQPRCFVIRGYDDDGLLPGVALLVASMLFGGYLLSL